MVDCRWTNYFITEYSNNVYECVGVNKNKVNTSENIVRHSGEKRGVVRHLPRLVTTAVHFTVFI